jgi:hypothetical protein
METKSWPTLRLCPGNYLEVHRGIRLVGPQPVSNLGLPAS